MNVFKHQEEKMVLKTIQTGEQRKIDTLKNAQLVFSIILIFHPLFSKLLLSHYFLTFQSISIAKEKVLTKRVSDDRL